MFNIDIEICKSGGGLVKIIDCIEAPMVITRLLSHVDNKAACATAGRLPPSRAPAQASLFG